MKKQLLVITILIAGYTGTSHAMLIALAATAKDAHPRVLSVGEVEKTSRHKNLTAKSDNSSVVAVSKSEDDHVLTAKKAGTTTVRYFDKKNKQKYAHEVTVAGTSIPKSGLVMQAGNKAFFDNKDSDRFKQTNKKETDSGRAYFRTTKKDFLRIHAKKAGTVKFENTKTGDQYQLTVQPAEEKTSK